MNASPARELGRQIGVGFVLTAFVALVTFMFSFLGTILCAAMIGMMVGFSKKWNWQFVLVSLLFPALLLASLHISKTKTEMSLKESLGLCAVCLGTFWATYLATRGLFLLEGKSPAPDRATGEATRRNRTQPETQPEWRDLAIEELQGAWLQEVPHDAANGARKVIRVHDHELTMSLVTESGETRVVAKGELQVGKPGRH